MTLGVCLGDGLLDALGGVLRWITQPTDRVVFLAESTPTFHDVLALPTTMDCVTGVKLVEAGRR